jgi:hypothetical protein
VGSGGFTGSVILGASASATNNGQFVLGSSAFPVGPVGASAGLSNTHALSLILNGNSYKIMLFQD